MNINIKATNIELTDSINSYLYKKLEVFEMFEKDDVEVLVFAEVGKTTNHHKHGDYHRAEFNMVINGEKFYTFSEKEDLYKSIDIARDDLLRKVKNSMKKRNSLIRRGASKIKGMIKGISGGRIFK